MQKGLANSIKIRLYLIEIVFLFVSFRAPNKLLSPLVFAQNTTTKKIHLREKRQINQIALFSIKSRERKNRKHPERGTREREEEGGSRRESNQGANEEKKNTQT